MDDRGYWQNLLFLVSSSVLGCAGPDTPIPVRGESQGEDGANDGAGETEGDTEGASASGTSAGSAGATSGSDGSAGDGGSGQGEDGATSGDAGSSSDTTGSASTGASSGTTGAVEPTLCERLAAKYVECNPQYSALEGVVQGYCDDYLSQAEMTSPECSSAAEDFFACLSELDCADFPSYPNFDQAPGCETEADAASNACNL